jgi:hypothetical protein
LFETINCLKEAANQGGSARGPATKAFRLLHVNLFPKVSVQEGRINIGLLDVKTVLNGKDGDQ